jgi:hypothetical protein
MFTLLLETGVKSYASYYKAMVRANSRPMSLEKYQALSLSLKGEVEALNALIIKSGALEE